MRLNTFENKNARNFYLEKDFNNKKNISKKEEKLLRNFHLLLKICLLILTFVSFTKIGNITRIRVLRLKEIKNSYIYEKEKFIKLSQRFDDLLSSQGEQRFMKDQDQMISRDILRVIWR